MNTEEARKAQKLAEQEKDRERMKRIVEEEKNKTTRFANLTKREEA